MYFHLKIEPSIGNPETNKISICWDQKNAFKLKLILGHFKYYLFLKKLFSDFSSGFRDNDIEFCHPGDGIICVSWFFNGEIQENQLVNNYQREIENIESLADSYKIHFGIQVSFMISKTDSSGVTFELVANKSNPYSGQHTYIDFV